MIKLYEINPTKTYKIRDNAIKSVDKFIANSKIEANLRYFIHTHTDGRFFPVFIGKECLDHGIHFKFNVVG